MSLQRQHVTVQSNNYSYFIELVIFIFHLFSGMRTHIRMHFDKKSTDFNEEHYISCILEEDVLEIPPVAQLAPTESVQPQLHCCDKCNYSSSYKGNVVRNIRMILQQKSKEFC